MIARRNNSRFTIMVVGSKESGKSTFLNSIINKNVIKQSPTDEIDIYLLNLDIAGTSQKISFIDTPGFGMNINDEELQDSIIEYIKEQFDSYIEEETKIRRNTRYEDTRVHCLIYLIPATGNGLKQRDIAFLRKAHTLVNIIPVITKAEGLLPEELRQLKALVLEQLSFYGIKTFDFDAEIQESPVQNIMSLNKMMPFACVFPEQIGTDERIRTHPYFIFEVDNPAHNDYPKLREAMLSSHSQAMIELTDSELYERYRSDTLENILHE